jgi:hypothetical protein
MKSTVARTAALLLAAFVANMSVSQAFGQPKDNKVVSTVAADSKALPEPFEQMHKLIRPQPNESKWAKVPWMVNLEEARKLAVDADKPILYWRAGGGDVLGRV